MVEYGIRFSSQVVFTWRTRWTLFFNVLAYKAVELAWLYKHIMESSYRHETRLQMHPVLFKHQHQFSDQAIL